MKDFRESNPKLHRLYVIYAQEDLQIIDKALEEFGSISRVNISIIGGLIHERRSMLLREDAAYQEALWRIQSNTLLEPDPEPSECSEAA